MESKISLVRTLQNFLGGGLMPNRDIDTTNSQFVGIAGNSIVIGAPKQIMTREQALIHAAWIVTIVHPSLERWNEILDTIQNS